MARSNGSGLMASRLLDAHLARSIEMFKGDDVTGKLSELADRMKRTRANLDKRADEMLARMDEVEKKAAGAFDGQHGQLDKIEAGLKEIEDAVHDLEGSNNPPDEEGSTASSSTFQGGER